MNNETILIAADIQTVPDIISKTLKASGYPVITARTVEKADALITADPSISLILIDRDIIPENTSVDTVHKLNAVRRLPLFLLVNTSDDITPDNPGSNIFCGYMIKNSGNTILKANIQTALKMMQSSLHERKLRKDNLILQACIESARDMAIFSLDREYRYLYFNTAHKEGMKNIYLTEPAIGVNIFDIMSNKNDIAEVKKLYDIVFTGQNREIRNEFGAEGHRKSFQAWHNPIIDKDGTIIGLTSYAIDISEKIDNLKKIEELSKFPEENPYPVLRLNHDGEPLFSNEAGELLIKYWNEKTEPDKRKKWLDLLHKSLETNTIYTEEAYLDEKVYSISIVPIPDKDFANIYGFDITIRKKAEEELIRTLEHNKNLHRELQHRAKNSFALISSMISLMKSSAAGKTSLEILTDVKSRIHAVSEMYSLLNNTGALTKVDLKQYLEKLVFGIPGSSQKIQIIFSGASAILPIKSAISTGIIINELTTNALKYAFPDDSGGKIKIELQNPEDTIVITVQDNGKGFEADDRSQRTSLGLMICRSLTEELSGTFQIDSSRGTKCTLEFPNPAEETAP